MGICWTESNIYDSSTTHCMTCNVKLWPSHHLHTRILLPSSKRIEARCRRTKKAWQKHERAWGTLCSSKRRIAQWLTITSQQVRGAWKLDLVRSSFSTTSTRRKAWNHCFSKEKLGQDIPVNLTVEVPRTVGYFLNLSRLNLEKACSFVLLSVSTSCG